ncbi:MAG: hypothetical protein CFE33_06200 [Pseudorhodobacter sp. PARRP1]|nr:MAG: hypothetical protein CFE33_06200 [Pseudorhodobacter sp. PARRP1]
MIRNFVTGIVVGGAVAGAGLGVVSQLTPLPKDAVQVAGGAVKPQDAVVVAEPAAVAPAVRQPEVSTPEVTAPEVSKPVADSKPAAVVAEKAPTAEVAPKQAAPTEAPAADAMKEPPADAAAPLPAPVTAPAAELPAKPPVASGEAPAGLNDPAAGSAPPQVQAGADLAPMPASPGPLAPDLATDATPAPADLPPPAPQETAETLLTPAPAPKAPTPSTIVLDPPPTPEEQTPVQPRPTVIDTSQPETLAPSGGLSKSVDGVTVGRLPSIAAVPDPAAPTEATPTEAAVAVIDKRPIAQYAAAFTNDLGKPEFAVLLVDNGAADLDRAKLAALPFAVSFVIDPLDPGAAAAAAIYRAAGKEVVMLASGIPTGAVAGDLEQTFQANAGVLPEAVAVMDLGAQGFQDNRPLASMVVPIIKEQGRGLVTFDAGLNAADQVARREDVPSALIFRDLDAGGEDTPLIRRYLDRAAFKAAQEGRVVVVGTTRPETIAALMEWSIEGKAASVALAPISAVLKVN